MFVRIGDVPDISDRRHCALVGTFLSPRVEQVARQLDAQRIRIVVDE